MRTLLAAAVALSACGALQSETASRQLVAASSMPSALTERPTATPGLATEPPAPTPVAAAATTPGRATSLPTMSPRPIATAAVIQAVPTPTPVPTTQPIIAQPDRDAPVIETIAVSPASVSPGATVTVTATLTDGTSGVRSVSVCYGFPTGCTPLTWTAGSAQSGTWTAQAQVPFTWGAGTLKPKVITVLDEAGNQVDYFDGVANVYLVGVSGYTTLKTSVLAAAAVTVR